MGPATLPVTIDLPAPLELMPPQDDSEWSAAVVERVRAGDREAFGELYDRYARLVHGILLARLPASEVADLVQEVFLQALRKLAGLRDPARFASWIAQIARRSAVDFYRAPRRRFETNEPAEGFEACAPELSAEGLAAFEALSRLPDAYRETLILRLVEGMSGAEIAAATGLTEGSVRVNLSRGLKRLRALLEGD